MLRWPDRATVIAAARAWTAILIREHTKVEAVAVIGSYARGDDGPGSDLDLVVVVAQPAGPVAERARELDTAGLPVPTDLLVYSTAEMQALLAGSSRFGRVLRDEALWLHGGPDASG